MSLPLEPIPMPPDGSQQPQSVGCGEFEPMLGLHLDRELTRAEEARLDVHLDECAKCRARFGHLEAMSSALKAWDVETNNAVPATDRIQRAVLSRVDETSHRRRIDDRVLRLVQFAAAASVLVALGLGLVFGLTWERPVDDSVAVIDPALPFMTESADLELPRIRSIAALPSMEIGRALEDLRGPGDTASALDDGVEFARTRGTALEMAQIARLDVFRRRLEQEAVLHGEIGERGVHVALPGQGESRLLSLSAWRFAKKHGWLDRWVTPPTTVIEAAQPPEMTASRTSPEAHEAAPFGLALRDVLRPLPGLGGEPVEGLTSAPTLEAWTGRVNGDARAEQRLRTRAIPRTDTHAPLTLRSGDGTARREALETVDPILAQQKGWLRFEESGIDRQTVVAFVKGNPKPILIPAGQILTAGLTDRVVAEPIVLPASVKRETREPVPCRVVRAGQDRDETRSPVLTSWIAGPTLRGLLAAGASEDAILAAVEAQVKTHDGRTLASWSLLDLYGQSVTKQRIAMLQSNVAWRGGLSGQGISGFVVTDDLDQVLGIEFVPLEGNAAIALMMRLYLGYEVEAAARVTGKFDSPATVELQSALEAFQADDTQLLSNRQSADGDVPSHRLSSVTIERAFMVFQSLEIEGQPAYVSGVPKSLVAGR